MGVDKMDYEVIYSSRRTVSLCVKDSRLIVRAPFGTSESRIREIVSSHSDWVERAMKKQQAPRRKDTVLTEEQIKELKKSARKILTAKTEYFSKIMGLKYGRITITSAKTRFGSCSSNGNISFSYLLMLYPEEAIDYVVVHELAHLVYMNHSSDFYKVIEGVLPDYKKRKKLLKQ